MDLEFDYIVTVAVFDISIDIVSDCWVPERVYEVLLAFLTLS